MRLDDPPRLFRAFARAFRTRGGWGWVGAVGDGGDDELWPISRWLGRGRRGELRGELRQRRFGASMLRLRR